MSDQPAEKRYTLAEASRELAAQQCMVLGHDVAIAYGEGRWRRPESLVCQRCYTEWDVTPCRHTSQPGEPVVEHALLMSGGSMQVRPGDAEMEQIYPLVKWIKNNQRFGGKVHTRTVIVVEDWHEVPRTP